MPGQIPRSDDVLAEAARHPCQAGGLQIKRLSGLYCKLGAAAVPQGQTVGALEEQRSEQRFYLKS